MSSKQDLRGNWNSLEKIEILLVALRILILVNSFNKN